MSHQAAVDATVGAQALHHFINGSDKWSKVEFAVALKCALAKAKHAYSSHGCRRYYFVKLARPAAKAFEKEKKQKLCQADLEGLARMNWASFEANYKRGHFEPLLPPRLQSKATRKKNAAAMALADKKRNHSIGIPSVTEEGQRPSGARPSKPKKHKVKRASAAHGKRPKRGAARGGRVPSGAVKPHKSKRKCALCGVIHTKSSHWSHEEAPRGGKRGGYKKARAK